jgi:hypothetical protein
MKALLALPVRSADYWHDDAVIICGDAAMTEIVESVGSNLARELLTVRGWPSFPGQPTLLVWEMDAGEDESRVLSYGAPLPGTCRLLTGDEWAAVVGGRVEGLFAGCEPAARG